MSSSTSSRSTFTIVPETMSPSLKYLIVSSIAARNSSSLPMSLTATCGVRASAVLLVMKGGLRCGLLSIADKEVAAAECAARRPRDGGGPQTGKCQSDQGQTQSAHATCAVVTLAAEQITGQSRTAARDRFVTVTRPAAAQHVGNTA